MKTQPQTTWVRTRACKNKRLMISGVELTTKAESKYGKTLTNADDNEKLHKLV
ncbi:3654_t:CDS:2 [Racocetra persica]|uniref:3654_t:CDS:1 n=1 Tax=Racocetra persica TaxID=160502 RepID=A0ACA9KTJ9_9GLOM|nr:3654_t:CDS:2 [Racocetra persica]